MKLSRGLALLAATVASVPSTLAWGGAGHEIVATIAQIYLHPSTLSNVCEVLYPGSSESQRWPPCYLSRVASWADSIKRNPKYRYTAAMHYVGAVGDHPSETCLFPGARGWAGKRDVNVLGAVRNMTNVLVGYTDGYYDRDAAEDAVKFLIHYVGDMHMPLHLTGRERGGNGARVTFDGRVTSKYPARSTSDRQLTTTQTCTPSGTACSSRRPCARSPRTTRAASRTARRPSTSSRTSATRSTTRTCAA